MIKTCSFCTTNWIIDDEENCDQEFFEKKLKILSNYQKYEIFLFNFFKLSRLTKIELVDAAWPMIKGLQLIRSPLVSDNRFFRQINFNSEKFLKIISNMMFAYGDGPKPKLGTVKFVLRKTLSIIVQYCNEMWKYAQEEKREEINCFDLIKLLSHNNNRLYRFFHFLTNSHMFGKELYPFSKPNHIVSKIYASFLKNEEFRKFCENPAADHDLASIRFSEAVQYWPQKFRIAWLTSRKISFCAIDGYLSPISATNFHQAIALPPLETDLIYYLDYLAREYIMELVYRAMKNNDSRNYKMKQNKYLQLTANDYLEASDTKNGDILFNIQLEKEEIDFSNRKKRKSSYDTTQFYTNHFIESRQQNALIQIRQDWWQKHQAPIEHRPQYNPMEYIIMRNR